MTDPIEKLVNENFELVKSLDFERRETMKQALDFVLPAAYARATNQHKTADHYAIDTNYTLGSGPYLATRFLERCGLIELGTDGVYHATEKGLKFMEDNYSGEELWGVKIR